jgi:hypothetical protein
MNVIRRDYAEMMSPETLAISRSFSFPFNNLRHDPLFSSVNSQDFNVSSESLS